MHAWRILSTLVVGATIALAPTTSLAAGDDSARAEAEALFRNGLASFDKADYARAYDQFAKANALVRRGSILKNLGLCEMKLARPVDALHHFRAAQATGDLAADQVRLLQANIESAYAQTGHISLELTEDAALRMDGEVLGPKSALSDPIDVTAGRHTFVVSADVRTATREVDAPAGELVVADLRLPHVAPAGPPPAIAPPVVAPLREVPVSPPQAYFWTARRVAGVAVTGAGIAAMLAGAYFDGQARSANDQANAAAAGLPGSACAGSMAPSACGAIEDRYSVQSRDETLDRVFLIGGGAAILAGAALFFWPSTPTKAAAALVPIVGPRSGGLAVRGEL